MSRLTQLRSFCRSLAKRGWSQLFEYHGFDLTAADFARELKKPLKIDRNRPGFEDFCLAGRRAIEPGDPARSLLYHALASPNVHPTPDGWPARDDCYPSPKDLDVVENYIYASAPVKVSALENFKIGVFAYEYRPAESTAHGYHADLVFSQTGIARVGNEKMAWDGPSRSFRPDPEGRSGISVCPSRFAAFLARAVNPDSPDPIMGRRDEQNDQIRTFYYPDHKLFAGTDCIYGTAIDLRFSEYHRNDKLRRIHTQGEVKVAPGFDINANPFVCDSLNDRELVSLETCGASVLVVPKAHRRLIRVAMQKNATSDRKEIVRFNVPPKHGDNRFWTSLQLPTEGEARRMPEYVNIRHPVLRTSKGLRLIDMKDWPERRFQNAIRKGNYEAAHFVDDTCDGAVAVTIKGIAAEPSLPAYSLVAAPDFFPLADQLEISNWVRRNYRNYQEHFNQGAPWPLCEGRRAANIELPRPDVANENAFDRDDLTVTAIIGPRPRSRQTQAPRRQKRFASSLPDAASNEFDPGWDVSLASDAFGSYLAAYGLGSPFPEDAKLCAALNSFWPAVAPDASRTFAFQHSPTAIPMLDVELGYHPDHPDVRAGRVKSARGWDGEFGPFVESRGGRNYVNAASKDRSDYVSNALAGLINVRKTSKADGSELIRRMDALRRSIAVLPPPHDHVSNTKLWLVRAEAIEEWDREASRADSRLFGRGFKFEFVRFAGSGRATSDPTRVRYRVLKLFECQISATNIVFRHEEGPWKFVEMPALETPPST